MIPNCCREFDAEVDAIALLPLLSRLPCKDIHGILHRLGLVLLYLKLKLHSYKILQVVSGE